MDWLKLTRREALFTAAGMLAGFVLASLGVVLYALTGDSSV